MKQIIELVYSNIDFSECLFGDYIS